MQLNELIDIFKELSYKEFPNQFNKNCTTTCLVL